MPPRDASAKAHKTAGRYFGATALGYDARRQPQEKWRAEDRALRAAIADLPAMTSVLDVPCGTGRFFGYYKERGFEAIGLDISDDMLAIARMRPGAECSKGDIFKLDLPDGAVDVTVTMRFMNLILAEDVPVVLGELQRVANKRVIFGLREGSRKTSHYHTPHPISLIESCLAPGWTMAHKAMHQEDYRLVALCAGST